MRDGAEIVEHALTARAIADDFTGRGRDVDLGARSIAEREVMQGAMRIHRRGDRPLVGLNEAEVAGRGKLSRRRSCGAMASRGVRRAEKGGGGLSGLGGGDAAEFFAGVGEDDDGLRDAARDDVGGAAEDLGEADAG
jgi:hypothetical protein